MSETIKIVGVGGGGLNALNCIIQNGIGHVEFIAMDTDQKNLESSLAGNKIALRKRQTDGSAFADPEAGRAAAMENIDDIKNTLDPADMIIIICGIGGGTASDASPVIAGVAKELGALTVAFVTMPFRFEFYKKGFECFRFANEGLSQMKERADALIITPADDFLTRSGQYLSGFSDEMIFEMLNYALYEAIRALIDMIFIPGLVNIDFSDVRNALCDSGTAAIGVGAGSGENRVNEAISQAINSPMMRIPMAGFKKALFQVVGGANIGIYQIEEAAVAVAEACDPDTSILWGHVFDARMHDSIRLTIIAAWMDKPRTARNTCQSG
jgi:cell division protein FtsZ